MKTQAKVVKAEFAGSETPHESATRLGDLYDALSRLHEGALSEKKMRDAVLDLMLLHGSKDVEAMLAVVREDIRAAKIQALRDMQPRAVS